VGGRCLLAHVVVATVCAIGVACELLLVLWCVVSQSGLSRAVDVASYAHGLIDLASDMPGGLVRSGNVMLHARHCVANAVYRNTAEHL